MKRNELQKLFVVVIVSIIITTFTCITIFVNKLAEDDRWEDTDYD